MSKENSQNFLDKIISFCKRRGFIFPSSEIYGGFESSYDFGPLGVELKNNIKKIWWDTMTKKHDRIVGLDAAILMSPKVWEASGHLSAGFADELVECKKCHKRFKFEEVKNISRCIFCGGELLPPRKFNLMMKTFVGPVEELAKPVYLRPETCQGIYINFKNILNSTRLKIPFGVAQIGKAFRNEITPRNFICRMREFEQMEMQWFCHPKEAEKWFEFWKEERIKWYLQLGIKKENLRAREIPPEERAHYAKRQVDIEYKFPFGWYEIEGVHNRGDWDLSNHAKFSGEDLRYYDESRKEKYFPFVIETSVGVERSFLAFLIESYQEISGGRSGKSKKKEILLQLNKQLAPIKIAIFPLLKNNKEIKKISEEIYHSLKEHFTCFYDEADSIGRRYRRQDEIGTPFCVTIDFQTLEDNTVTIRDRDTMKQIRVKKEDLVQFFKEIFENLEAKNIFSIS